MNLRQCIGYERHGHEFRTEVENLICHFENYMLNKNDEDAKKIEATLSKLPELFKQVQESGETAIKVAVVGDMIIPINCSYADNPCSDDGTNSEFTRKDEGEIIS